MIISFLDYFGTAIFAISGVLLACKIGMDAVGVLVLASAVAIGGGTIRDAILGATPVFWIHSPIYLWIIIFTCIFSLLLIDKIKVPSLLLPILDAIGLGAFVVIGVQKSLIYSDSYTVAIVMGVLTGCGGGVLRDVLARQMPFIFQKEIYATACIIGAVVMTICLHFDINQNIAAIASFLATVLIRIPAIIFNLSMKNFKLKN